jgi:hypothetical protein
MTGRYRYHISSHLPVSRVAYHLLSNRYVFVGALISTVSPARVACPEGLVPDAWESTIPKHLGAWYH